MNADILKKGGIDYDFGVKRFAGRAQLFEKALTKFPKDSTMTRIKEAYASGDMVGLQAGAHEFKGMCGNIGLTALYRASDEMVQMLRGGVYTSQELSAAYEGLCELYNSIFKTIVASMEETI